MSADAALPWSTEPFGTALRAALAARRMSFRDLESRSLVPVGNLHDHASGKPGVPGDDLLARIAAGVGVDPDYFREWRERRLIEALRGCPRVEVGSRGGGRPASWTPRSHPAFDVRRGSSLYCEPHRERWRDWPFEAAATSAETRQVPIPPGMTWEMREHTVGPVDQLPSPPG